MRTEILLAAMIFGSLSLPAPAAGQTTDQLYTRRFAFLVGANDGGKGRITLRYAVDDARAIGGVFEEMGGILPGDSRLLEEPDRDTFFREIKILAENVARAKDRFRRVEVIFYYSGHSDEESIFLGDDRVSYREFKDLITTMNADVRIAIIDSCASGALALPKGVIKRPPFLMDTAYDMKGYAFMTSSSASEAAQESGRLKRSYFTHNLISGMRGAADMNQDGRITLNEAYQFAFDGTLTQTEKTMAGPQHPNYHIQMSGTGDVVITEIGKSTAVLVIKKGVSGKVYVHNRDNVLVVELGKAAGREISIGLNAGEYRIINIDGGDILETKVSLEDGKSLELDSPRFTRTDRIPTQLRGSLVLPSPETGPGQATSRWRIEMFGGFTAINPEDLNLRPQFDSLSAAFYNDDYFHYQKSRGEIRSYVKSNQGGKPKLLKHSLPAGIRVRYGITAWLDVSLGLTHFSNERESSFRDDYEVVGKDGLVSVYSEEFKNYRLAAEGFVPSMGIHLAKDLSPSLRMEAYFSGGPLFAECSYSMLYDTLWATPDLAGDLDRLHEGSLEEKGKGVGLSLQAGTKMDFRLAKHVGMFVEGGYAFQNAYKITGPGTRIGTSAKDLWEGEWAIKQDVKIEPWGTGRFLWPSNGWVIFPGTWWRARDFKLDLSGFQAKLGVFYRF